MKRKLLLLLPLISMLCSCGESETRASQLTSYSTSILQTSYIGEDIEYYGNDYYTYINTYVVGLRFDEGNFLFICKCGKEAYGQIGDINEKTCIGDKVTIYNRRDANQKWHIESYGYWLSDTYNYWCHTSNPTSTSK